MPAYNPYIGSDTGVEAWDGSPLVTLSTLYQSATPGPQAVFQGAVSDLSGQASSSTNAAGTSENVAMDVAVIVIISALFVWALRKTGFRFVVAGGVG